MNGVNMIHVELVSVAVPRVDDPRRNCRNLPILTIPIIHNFTDN
jgi:hypothetical protein